MTENILNVKQEKIDLSGNYASKVLSYYLWGQETPPEPHELKDTKWMERTETIELKIDSSQFIKQPNRLMPEAL